MKNIVIESATQARLPLVHETRMREQGAVLAAAFSPVVLRRLARKEPASTDARIGVIASLLANHPTGTLGEAFDAAHRILARSYRSEYVFKNELISRIIFGRHSPRTASALVEQHMGSSCADVLVLNGTSTVYEIKTDLDDFSRLSGQLESYSTRAEYVFVASSMTRADALAARVPENVGVIGLHTNGRLTVAREAISNLDRIDVSHLFGMLRVAELEAILGRTHRYVPEPHQSRAWYAMRDLFHELSPTVAHAETLHELRARGQAANTLLTDRRLPRSLRALACAKPQSTVGTKRILDRLSSRASLFLGVATAN